MNTFLQIGSTLTDQKLIISDEFETFAEAASYRDLFIASLFDRVRMATAEDLSHWLEKAFKIEILQADSHPDIQPKEVDEAITSIHEDVERVIEFMDHVFSEVESASLQEEFEFISANQQ